VKKGDLLELDITGYAFEGKGISKIIKELNIPGENDAKKFVVFVNGAYPGDKVLAQITKIRKAYAEAKIKKKLIGSSLRISPKCKYFGVCGGCKSQNLNYENQLLFKEEQVKDLFERIGGFNQLESLPIISSAKTYFYRNKMEYSFSDKRWLSEEEVDSKQEFPDRNFALGLHIPGIYDKVLDIDECWLQSELSNEILNFTRTFFKKEQIQAYSPKNHTGFLRNLVLKQSFSTNDIMVNLVTAGENERLFASFRDELLRIFPKVTTLIFNINRKLSQTAYGDYEIVAYGPGFIIDSIGESKYRISANSFFQTNSLQAEMLFNVAKKFAELTGNETVYDLYSGAGTIPIFISKNVKQICGFESVEPAIKDAEVNIDLNSVKNFTPILADLNKSFLPIIRERNLPLPEIVITDPPRGGMHTRTVQDLLDIRPNKIVYISCNPATQARDIKLLGDGGYQLIKIQPVDMFPHTYHIENVALLLRK
jgi:23S rRNA (uracil1939-C5)-methyltransferase